MQVLHISKIAGLTLVSEVHRVVSSAFSCANRPGGTGATRWVQDAHPPSFPRWPAKSVRDGAGQGCNVHIAAVQFALMRAGTHVPSTERGNEEKRRFAATRSFTRANRADA